MVALLGIVGSSVFSLTGWEQGWARLCKEDLQTESSPYAGMMQYLLIRYPDKDGLTPDFVAAIEFQLPDPKTTTFRIKLKWVEKNLAMFVFCAVAEQFVGDIWARS